MVVVTSQLTAVHSLWFYWSKCTKTARFFAVLGGKRNFSYRYDERAIKRESESVRVKLFLRSEAILSQCTVSRMIAQRKTAKVRERSRRINFDTRHCKFAHSPNSCEHVNMLSSEEYELAYLPRTYSAPYRSFVNLCVKWNNARWHTFRRIEADEKLALSADNFCFSFSTTFSAETPNVSIFYIHRYQKILNVLKIESNKNRNILVITDNYLVTLLNKK